MADLLPITLDDQIAELEREIRLRQHLYPRWVSNGRMKQEDADRYLARIDEALATLLWVRRQRAMPHPAPAHQVVGR